MPAIWSGSHGWQIERGDYGWNVNRVAKTAKGDTVTKDLSYHGTLEQACIRIARHVSDEEAKTLQQYAASLRAVISEFERSGARHAIAERPVEESVVSDAGSAQRRKGKKSEVQLL